MATRITAIGRLDRQRVAVADVAGHTRSGRRGDMHAGKRETSDAVIEGSEISPRDGVVAI